MSDPEQTSMFTDAVEIERNPVLPYGGEHGSAGTDTSRSRAKSGAAGRAQPRIVHALALVGEAGATVSELRESAMLSDIHHGTVSGALSELHKGGVIYRLTEVRDRCRVYVTAPNVAGREFDRPGLTSAGVGARVRACEVDGGVVVFGGRRFETAVDLLAALREGL